MGGNVTAITKSGKETRAEKVQLKEIGRTNFIKKVEATLKVLNNGFYKKFGRKIWEDESQIDDAYVFNGSTSFVMNTDYSDDDILPYKSSVGDVDLTVPEEDKEGQQDDVHPDVLHARSYSCCSHPACMGQHCQLRQG